MRRSLPSLHYLRIHNGKRSREITIEAPYLAIVFLEISCDVDLQWDVSRELVRSGCLVMMATGRECSSWDDSVDMANRERFDFGPVPDNQFVMTGWHERESLADVFWLAEQSGREWADVPINLVMIVHVGESDREADFSSFIEKRRRRLATAFRDGCGAAMLSNHQ